MGSYGCFSVRVALLIHNKAKTKYLFGGQIQKFSEFINITQAQITQMIQFGLVPFII